MADDKLDVLGHWTGVFHAIIVEHVETARDHCEPWHAEELAEELAERVTSQLRGAVDPWAVLEEIADYEVTADDDAYIDALALQGKAREALVETVRQQPRRAIGDGDR